MNIVDVEEIDKKAGIYVIYLNNAETRNSMTLEMGLAFHRSLQGLASLDPLPRVVIITGRNNVFSSGGDFKLLRSFAEKSQIENREFMESFYRLFLSVREMPFPVIACVNGHAIGAALSLALACDLRLFLPHAKYAFNFVRIGIHPGMGASFLLKEVAGLNQAQELLITGRTITGTEAFNRGLCHGVYNEDTIFNEALSLAHEISSAAPNAVRLLKRTLYTEDDLYSALRREAECQAENYVSQDFIEAISAIQEKRTPTFNDK
ncbi:MAG: enoyl-CoA hydratase/isomerase family protein [Leptonema sp. (in: Bacteria)]|nr:enoyl-CoA hydratase/isomerase family protein [Leptonema sp. (in: bacteria)]